MPEMDLLEDLVVIVGASVVVVSLLRRLGIPSIAGFILTGAITGPAGLGLVSDTHRVEVLAEVGVVILLFGIGLELSLERIRRLWKAVVLGGGFQVAVTVGLGAAVAMALGSSWNTAVFVGCVLAVSSTAIVLRALSARGELEAPHGRLAVGILVFQDLCVVPMMLAVPHLAGQGAPGLDAWLSVGAAVAILAGVLLAAGPLVPRLLGWVARTRQRDLFVLTVFLVCFGTAWLVSTAGVSLALGAFLAGLVVAGSESRHQALSDLVPVREVLASLFFVSVGMLLDPTAVWTRWDTILALLAAILAGKFVVVGITARVLQLPLRVAILSATLLCQVGEFSFVLLEAARGTELLGPVLAGDLLVAIILSMGLTPLVVATGPHLASSAARVPWLNRVLEAEPPRADGEEPHADHVVVAGYGPAGRAVCRMLRQVEMRYVLVDLNPDNVRAARADGHYAVLGDVTQREILEVLGCSAARLVVLGISDTRAVELAVRTLSELAPGVPTVVRTHFQSEASRLEHAGATRVVSSESTARMALMATCRDMLSLSSTEVFDSSENLSRTS